MLMTVAFIARQRGTFIVSSLDEKIATGWLSRGQQEYKYNGVYFAAQHFAKNERLVWRKAQVANVVFGLLLIESALLLAWIYRIF